MFPAYFKSIRTDAVVLFISPQEGTVVEVGNSTHHLGYSSNIFVPCTDITFWTPTYIPTCETCESFQQELICSTCNRNPLLVDNFILRKLP